jgi:IclR family pca regulon transcriptional regulator
VDFDTGRPPYFVRSVERALTVIRAFGPDATELTLSEVARATGLDRAAARRFLLTLTDLGYVRSDGRQFALTPRVLELGYSYLSALSLPEIAEPHLERLATEVRETASLAVLDDDVVVVSADAGVGARYPAYATALGRVLLAGLTEPEVEAYLVRTPLRALTPRTLTGAAAVRAELARVRGQGWALDDRELEEELRAVAAPVRGRNGQVLAAVGVASRRSVGDLRRDLLPPLLATAARIEADLAVSRGA